MPLLRAVFYCRCSTEEESQIDALHKQVLESEACIGEQGWCLVDRYVESKSGTTTKGRTEYNRLYEDLLTDKFDIIVIKSQDRLMRNVKDWYLFLDRMLTRGKRLFMYLERKFYSTDDALITGIKAILAEEYSRELSKKINNAHQHRQKNGGKAMLTSRVFGFSKKEDGTLIVVDEEAEIIRQIYEYCAAGYGSRTIANIFFNQGYVKRTGSPLTASAIGKIIRNPLYQGTMVMNRRHYDFETKRTVKQPKEEWIYRQGMVPGIVDSKLWEQANRAMDGRTRKSCAKGGYIKGTRTGRYDLSGKLICASCGKPYYRTWRPRYSLAEKKEGLPESLSESSEKINVPIEEKESDKNTRIIEWKCSGYLEKGRKNKGRLDKLRKVEKKFSDGCDNVHLDETIVFSLLEQVCRQIYYGERQNKDNIIRRAVDILQKTLENGQKEDPWEQIEKEEVQLNQQKDFLLTKFLEGVIADKDYRRKDDELEDKLRRLNCRKEEWKQKEWERKNLEQRIVQIKARLEGGGVEKATTAQMIEELREIRVHEWQLELCFDPLRMLSMPDAGRENQQFLQEITQKEFTLWIDYPFSPETKRGRYLDRRRIMEWIKKDPSTTAKEIAGKMGRSVYMVRNRIVELTRGGYLCFRGRGGHGEWEILRELPDKEESFRNDGL